MLNRPPYALFFRLALLALGLVVVQIVLGATVRATGSGMGCPDWPLCHGQFWPAWNMESILEYSHRAVAAGVTLMLTALGIWIAIDARLRAPLGRLAAITAWLIGALIGFGAITVAYDMPPAVVACHLALAALLMATWLTVACRARELAHDLSPERPEPGPYRLAALVALAVGMVQLFLGAMVSVSHAGLACPDFPGCYGMALPPLVGNVGVQMIHRFGAYTLALSVAVLVVLAEWGAGARVRHWARLAALAVVLQIGLGVATVLLKIPTALSIAHLATGMALFATLYMVVYYSFPRLWAGPPDGPAVADPPPGVVPRFSRATLAAYYQLTKPSIVLLVVLTGLPAIMIASPGAIDWGLALAALGGTALAASSAATFNQYFERERDKAMVRTAKRPIPSGIIAPRHALIFAITLGLLATAVLAIWTTWLALALALGSLIFYGFYYTLVLKDQSPQNIVIGGVAGATAPLIAWAAVTGTVGLPAWIMFMTIFLWTPPHFWALAIYRLDDYRHAGIPMFPVVYGVPATTRWIVIYTLVLVPLTLLLVPLGAAGPIYLISALALGLGFLALAGKVLVTQNRKDAIKLFAYSIVYTLALFTSLTVDAACGGPGVITHLVAWVQ